MSAKDLAGKTCIVTGANTGIGRVTAEDLARRGAKVWLACRSEEKTKPVLDAIRSSGGAAEFLALDLADLTATRRAAERYLATSEPLHVLVNNAGLAGVRGMTKDGFEMTFGTNYVGPFLFTSLLLPRLRQSAPARIVNVASNAHYRATGIDWDAVRKPTASRIGMAEYQMSKLANILFTKELAHGRAGEGVHSYALHPGVVASDIWRRVPAPLRAIAHLFMKTNEEGARTSIYCAASPAVANDDGLYYDEQQARRPSRVADDEALAKELWQRTEAWIAPHLDGGAAARSPRETSAAASTSSN